MPKDDFCAEHSAFRLDIEHVKEELIHSRARTKTMFDLIEHRAPRWVLIVLTGIFISIAGAQFLQMDDIKERVIVLQTKMDIIQKKIEP